METRYRITNGALSDPITFEQRSPDISSKVYRYPKTRARSRRRGIFRRRVGYDGTVKPGLTMRGGFYAVYQSAGHAWRLDLPDFTLRVRRLAPKSRGNFITAPPRVTVPLLFERSR